MAYCYIGQSVNVKQTSFFQERPIAYHRQKYDAIRKIYYLSYMNRRLQY